MSDGGSAGSAGLQKRIIDWRVEVVMESPFIIGQGRGIEGVIDRLGVRDPQGLPYIPGSTLKGVYRAAARRFLKALDSCAPAGARPICDHDLGPGGESCAPPAAEACVICRWFGSARIEGTLWFGSLVLAQQSARLVQGLLGDGVGRRTGFAGIRARASISRALRSTVPERLFVSELFDRGLAFSGRLHGQVFTTQEEAELMQRILTKGLERLGGGRSVGWGKLAVTVTEGSAARGDSR
jgi:CRISPR/Cas system CSM-associated protein Csm3 (group 7 of RAMP superfamily)